MFIVIRVIDISRYSVIITVSLWSDDSAMRCCCICYNQSLALVEYNLDCGHRLCRPCLALYISLQGSRELFRCPIDHRIQEIPDAVATLRAIWDKLIKDNHNCVPNLLDLYDIWDYWLPDSEVEWVAEFIVQWIFVCLLWKVNKQINNTVSLS